MNENKEKLVDLVIKHNVSAIMILSEKLKLEPDVVIELVNELIAENILHGMITEDGARFFSSDAKVSDAPVIPRDEKMPEFLSYNSRPGIVTAIIGFIVLIGGALIGNYATDITEENFAAVLFLVGLVIFLIGLYLVTKRDAPD